MKLVQKISLVFIAQLMFAEAFAQGLPPKDPLKEIFRISEYYRQTPYLSFTTRSVQSDSANPATVYLRENLSYKLSSGRFNISGDSTLWLQGGQYQLHISHREARITLENILKYPPVFPMALSDAAFRKANVDTMFMKTESDPYKRLMVRFKTSSPYSSIEIVYHGASRRIRSLVYYLREGQSSAESGLTRVESEFENYASLVFEQDIFKEDVFVRWSDGQPALTSQFSSYTLFSSFIQ